MKKIGLVGGLGPESTLDYYRLIIRAFQERKSRDYPEILIYSTNLTEGLTLMEATQRGPLTEWLLHKIEALHRAGARSSRPSAPTAPTWCSTRCGGARPCR